MVAVIREDQIPSAEIWRYADVLAVRPGERESGVEIWRARNIGKVYASTTTAEVTIHQVLLVEVDDPDDPATVDRLRAACADAWRTRP